ncbi:MAG: deoxyribonuclease IV [Patescibacteria group bacterium]|jgi:deoxyribonuclease-4
MYFGAHISAAGGADNVPERAAELGCEVVQFFSRSPQGGPAPELTPRIIERFKTEMRNLNLRAAYIHTPYFINFASQNNHIREGTIQIIRGELERGTLLGVEAVMTHLGSAKTIGLEKGIIMTIDGMVEILKDYRGSTKLLIEIAAGSGETLGDTFEELNAVITGVEKKLRKKDVLNVCLDTQHLFASGYDIRTPQALTKTINQFDQVIGLKKLKLFHGNDSKKDLGSHVDRHENIGKGKLGKKTFAAIIAEPRLKNTNLILETPRDDKGTEIKKELRLLKQLRGT